MCHEHCIAFSFDWFNPVVSHPFLVVIFSLESVCFAILIGISCDFVIHFSHAYSSLPGDRSRHERSKYAMLRMGPSILAATFTTICAAIVMLFTTITFFQKFAQVLFYTVLMATVGSFIVFITLSDTFGPSRPTVLVDAIVGKVKDTCCKEKENETSVESEQRPVVAKEKENGTSVESKQRHVVAKEKSKRRHKYERVEL